MAEEVLNERSMSIDEYLALFEKGSGDYELVKTRSGNIREIIVKQIRGDGGQLYEDTTFIEKTGVTYTIRAKA
jgi:hypothetical protein